MILRENWQAESIEDVVDPGRPIIDAHHHIFDQVKGFPPYSFDAFCADTEGHNIIHGVYVECGEHYLTDGEAELAPVGETRWVQGIATHIETAAGSKPKVSAIVGHGDICLGEQLRPVLEAHQQASPLFRGIRDVAAWEEGEGFHRGASVGHGRMYAEPAFREGLRVLASMGLSYDAYNYHTQLDGLADLAEAVPEATIILNHLGTPLGVGPFAGRREAVFSLWQQGISRLGKYPNVIIKLGGLAMPWTGFGWDSSVTPPSSDDIVAAQGRYYHHAIESFGPDRCMFESNFPVEKLSVSYRVLWNGFKKMAARYSEVEKHAMFYGTAARIYRIEREQG